MMKTKTFHMFVIVAGVAYAFDVVAVTYNC